jgi:hypothetical protein
VSPRRWDSIHERQPEDVVAGDEFHPRSKVNVFPGFLCPLHIYLIRNFVSNFGYLMKALSNQSPHLTTGAPAPLADELKRLKARHN